MAAQVTLVCGPPCSGKNTYVSKHANPGDLVIDFDAIIEALGGSGGHDQPLALKPFAFAARDAVLAHLWDDDRDDLRRAWIIQSAPSRRQRQPYRMRGCRIVMLLAERDTLRDRAGDERPQGWESYIDNWLNEYETADVDEIIRTD